MFMPSLSWSETFNDGKHILVVKNATRNDRGTYKCTVINRLGRATSSGLLNVHGFTAKRSESAYRSRKQYFGLKAESK